jgi:hypothetical protein
MTLVEWATKWGVSIDALRDLATSTCYIPPTVDDGSESRQQSLVRLEAAKRRNVYLFRNNVGACTTDTGSFVRYGLANDTPAMNAAVKSADLIGFRSKLIVQADVGTVVAQFVSREVKHATWHWRNSPEEQAQLKWAALINTHGGDAAIVTGPGSL